MSTIALIALYAGRENSIHISLPLAACIFTTVKPTIIYDVGFQLSILATMGLVYLAPSIENCLLKFFKAGDFIKNYILTTLSCTLSTLPITIFTFKTFSIWSIPSNILILPIVESTMFWGVLALILNIFNPVVSKVAFLVSYVQLKYFELVVSFVGSLGVGYSDISSFAGGILSVSIILVTICFCIYFYPINNEVDNYYIKIS
jgi:competence protein ComEC